MILLDGYIARPAQCGRGSRRSYPRAGTNPHPLLLLLLLLLL
ncbi:hypothetical protein GLA29479_2450 [Lysobacter antibioticus]|nr:hypothetical protein GLA29479_2450 [Lysobacter antibioticus]